MYAVHEAYTGGRPGRKWFTTEVNHAIIARTAAEFQGFCRDLYLEAATGISSQVGDPGLASIFQLQFGSGLKLSRDNAQKSSLGADFGRLGFKFWDEIESAYPTKGPVWGIRLELINDARNAIAHQDDAKLSAVRARTSLDLGIAKRWRTSLGELAKGMDTVVQRQVTALIGVSPW